MKLQVELNYVQRSATRLAVLVLGLIGMLLARDNTKTSIAVVLLTLLMVRNLTTVYAVAKTIGRDLRLGFRFLTMNLYVAYLEHKRWSVARLFQQTVRKHPNKTCFMMDDRTLTFQEVQDYTNRVGAYFRRKGLQRGDCVALLMETRPEYVGLWLGLSQIGVVTALINSNLRRETLLHSIRVVKARAIIVGTELTKTLQDVRLDKEVNELPVYQFSDDQQRDNDNFELIEGAVDLTIDLKAQPIEDLSAEINACEPKDKLMYVYTSGTTGLPKAAVITNLRYLFMATACHHMVGLEEGDVIYNPLPLYHTAGGIVGVGNSIVHGCTVALRKKFSASNFWKDCIKYDCTAAQYIGELCRYLLSTPAKPEDKAHHLRVMYGNGLREQIWTQFVSRFNIPNIAELYGSTEGNSNLANVTNQVGAVGCVPIVGRRFMPVQIIKCDEETGEPVLNSRGYCVRCKAGETGLLIGKVIARHAVTAFNGYADKGASEKKLLRDVFTKGDSFFNSGDMVVADILGYIYFKDRTGDTFRWRGENVATQEVEAIITNAIGLQDCVVYGVDIPHVEGKAGMAAIVDPESKVDLQYLSIGIRGSLPAYAQPLFIRLMDDIPRTATFKLKKRDLMTEGFDIRKVRDPIYYLNKDSVYRPLTPQQFDDLLNGRAGL